MRRGLLTTAVAGLLASGCTGAGPHAQLCAPTAGAGRAPFTRAGVEAAFSLPDALTRAHLPGARGLARQGSEFRIGARALHVTAPSWEAEALSAGSGDGFFVVYRPEESGDEADVCFELVLERSAHEEEDSARAAEYWRACAGFRWSDAWSSRLEPFVSAGASYNRIEVSGGDVTAGLGIYGGAGVEFLVSGAAAAAIEAKLHRFWSSIQDGSGGALAAVVAVGAAVRF